LEVLTTLGLHLGGVLIDVREQRWVAALPDLEF
jgi:hypothetical protein